MVCAPSLLRAIRELQGTWPRVREGASLADETLPHSTSCVTLSSPQCSHRTTRHWLMSKSKKSKQLI